MVGELAEDGLVDCRDRRKGRRGIGLTNRAGVSRHAFLAAIRQIRNSGWRWAGCRVDRGIEGGREGGKFLQGSGLENGLEDTFLSLQRNETLDDRNSRFSKAVVSHTLILFILFIRGGSCSGSNSNRRRRRRRCKCLLDGLKVDRRCLSEGVQVEKRQTGSGRFIHKLQKHRNRRSLGRDNAARDLGSEGDRCSRDTRLDKERQASGMV